MKIFKSFFNLIIWFFLFVVFIFALFTVSSNFNVFVGYRSFLVQSGSMEPSIMIGDIVIAKQQNDYGKNDVVTFLNREQRVVTHRIIEVLEDVNRIKFITKGDANRSEDEDQITSDQIIGKVVFVIPKLGFFVSFAKSLPGLIILVIIPSIILVVNQIIEIKNG